MRRFSKFFPRVFKVFPQRIQSFQAYVGEGEQSSVHTAWTGAQQRMLEYASCAARGVCKLCSQRCMQVVQPHVPPTVHAHACLSHMHTHQHVFGSPHMNMHACVCTLSAPPPPHPPVCMRTLAHIHAACVHSALPTSSAADTTAASASCHAWRIALRLSMAAPSGVAPSTDANVPHAPRDAWVRGVAMADLHAQHGV